MAENGGNIKLQVGYEVNKSSEQLVQNSIERIKSKSKGVQTAFTNAFSKIGSAIKSTISIAAVAVTAVLAGIAKISSSAMAAYKVQAEAETKLQTIMRQRMGATDAQIDKIKELTKEYQKLGLVGDEVAAAGMAQLSMFISNASTLEKLLPNFENALVGLYGMDASTGNAQSLATAMGKALSQGKTTGLAKIGIVFTEAEQKAFALGNEIERANMLSAKLQKTFGNVNSELAKTPTGRIAQLKNSISDVMELFGEAFTNVFAAFVPMLQTIVGWLDAIAQKLVQISQLIYTAFGGVIKKAGGGGVADTLSEIAEGYEEVGGAAGGAKESVASFDNVVQLADSSGGGGGAGGSAFDLAELDMQNSALEKTEGIIDSIGKKIKDYFSKPLFDMSAIKANLKSIGSSAKEILEGVQPSAERMMQSFANSIKTRAETVFLVGKSVVTALTGGIAQWLDEGKERITASWSRIFESFANAFDNISEITTNIGSLLSNFFELESVRNAIANAFTAVEEAFTGTVELISRIFEETTNFINQLISDNYADIEEFLAGIGELLENTTSLIRTVVHDVFTSILEKFNKYVKPVFERLLEGTNKIVKAVLGAWNGSIQPLLMIVIDSLKKLWSDHIKPFVDKVLDLVGVFISFCATIYNKVIAPIVGFVMDYMVPYISAGLSMIWGFVEGLLGDIFDAVGGLIEFIKGTLQLLDGILNGDTEAIVEGLKSIYHGLVTYIANAFTSIVNAIIGALNGVIRAANRIKIPGTDVGVNISEIPTWQPQLAEGGIVYKPTDFGNFTAGEAGAEAIVPLQNSSYTKILASEIVKGLKDAGFGGGDTYNIENAFGDDRSMERLVNKIEEVKQKKEARKGAVVYG